MKRVVLAAIRLYQRHISPHKGFVCSFRVHTGQASCSTFGYMVIDRYGVLRGAALLRRRLKRCSDEYRKHATHMHPGLKGSPALRRQSGHVDLGCDAVDAESCACDVLDICGDLPCDFGEWRRRKKQRREPEQYIDIPPNSRIMTDDPKH